MHKKLIDLHGLFWDSENYIFGKFDTFTKRLEKISRMVTTFDKYAGIGDVKMEGIEEIAESYRVMVETIKKKTYDVLDFRRSEVIVTVK